MKRNCSAATAAVALAAFALPFTLLPAQPAANAPEMPPHSDVAPYQPQAERAVVREADGLLIPVEHGWLRLQVRADNIVRVAVAADPHFFTRESLVVLPASAAPARWSSDATGGTVTLTTAQLQVRVDRQTGAVSFLTPDGSRILAERAGSRKIEPAIVQGETTHHIEQAWEPNADESLYGLGQQQLGVVDIKDYDLDLWQHNGTVVVPFLVSSRGYGILWDNLSFSRFGDLRPFEPIPAEKLSDAGGEPGGLTAAYFGDANFGNELFRTRATDIAIKLPEESPNTALHPGLPAKGAVGVRWTGSLKVDTAGVYAFQTTSSNGERVWIDDKLVFDDWFEGWLPYAKTARVALTAGTHALRVEWTRDANGNVMQLRWKPPGRADRPTTLWSEVGDGVDYTFVYGPQLDRVIAGYRELTGRATLMPIWSLGLWQSRQRYETAQQSLDVLAEYRKRRIPIDNIVQDWFYWRKDQWGSHQFDPARFPDPQAWVNAIHEQHARVMISVWGKFYPGNGNYEALHQHGFLYEPLLWQDVHDWVGFTYTDYDAFNPEARKLFWAQVRDALFTKKIDAWWMDATEPDISSPPDLDLQKLRMNPTALGASSKVLNGYALENSRGVYEGQRGAAPDQRVFILTRSGFAGIQRYASATWSGDMPCTWDAMRRQIAAGLGYSISGVPYWSMDIGGFTAPPRFVGKALTEAAQDEWNELNARWFEFGTFVPLVRLHGESQDREPWAFGGDNGPAYHTIVAFDELRYRLLPYVYSLAGAVTQDGTTFMRPLGMDFPADATARAAADEYLFGPALLVAPVTQYKARQRRVYLPDARGGWFDFWTGNATAGGRSDYAPAPYERIPVFVRAGSIVPFGPALQYTTEKPADPITLYVYAGADGAFNLYEDDGLTYGYEHGAFARIPIKWDDGARTLTIGARAGSFPGMLQQRTFNLVLVSAQRAVGYDPAIKPDQTLTYRGEAIDVVLK